MLLRLMKRSPWCTVYHENNERAMREHSRLRDEDTIRGLIRDEPRVFPVFKPLNDAQYALSQLSLHPRARGVWLYRDYSDVVNSMVEKWGDAQQRTYRVIAETPDGAEAPADRDDVDAAIFREGMSADTLANVRALVDCGMTSHEAAALHWYCRNRLYFELGLDRDPRVELVRYEDLVSDPDLYLRRVFDFVGCGYRPEWAKGVFKSSVKKREAPSLCASADLLCDSLSQALSTEYLRRIGTVPAVTVG